MRCSGRAGSGASARLRARGDSGPASRLRHRCAGRGLMRLSPAPTGNGTRHACKRRPFGFESAGSTSEIGDLSGARRALCGRRTRHGFKFRTPNGWRAGSAEAGRENGACAEIAVEDVGAQLLGSLGVIRAVTAEVTAEQGHHGIAPDANVVGVNGADDDQGRAGLAPDFVVAALAALSASTMRLKTHRPKRSASCSRHATGRTPRPRCGPRSSRTNGFCDPWEADRKPELCDTPIPRFDLLDLSAYGNFDVQFSLGCSFCCEIISLCGRRPRTKPTARFIADLDILVAADCRSALQMMSRRRRTSRSASLGRRAWSAPCVVIRPESA